MSKRILALATMCVIGSMAPADTVDRASPYYSKSALLLREVLPGRGVEMPETLYPREELGARWQEADADPELRKASAKAEDRAAKYLRIADAQWVEMLPNRSTAPHNHFLENWLYNQNYYDAISTEGSAGYSNMMSGMKDVWAQMRGKYDPDYLAKHPFLQHVGSTSKRMVTLHGKHSEHGDAFDGFGASWPSCRSGLGPDGKELREPSVSWPGFGVSLMRGGGAGRRLEISLSHDRVTGHGHDDMLGMQVFYQGVPIINHLGYCVVQRSITLDPEKSPHAAAILALPYPRRLIPRDEVTPAWEGGYQYHLESSPLTKNTVVVDQLRGHGAHGC